MAASENGERAGANYRRATQHLLDENRVLQKLNKLQQQELGEIRRVLEEPPQEPAP